MLETKKNKGMHEGQPVSPPRFLCDDPGRGRAWSMSRRRMRRPGASWVGRMASKVGELLPDDLATNGIQETRAGRRGCRRANRELPALIGQEEQYTWTMNRRSG